jgi:hypothetical protein
VYKDKDFLAAAELDIIAKAKIVTMQAAAEDLAVLDLVTKTIVTKAELQTVALVLLMTF